MRSGIKKLVETAAHRSGLVGVISRWAGCRDLILAYHNIVPDGEEPFGERSLHLAADLFRQQLEMIGEYGRVVPLGRLLAADPDPDPEGTDDPRVRVALTFDDAYRGAVECASVELATHGFPATFFINPGLCGEAGFWWDRLAEPHMGVLPVPTRNHCLERLQGRQAQILDWAGKEGIRGDEAPEHARPSSEEEIEALAGRPGISIECHTWSHPNLVALTPSERMLEFQKVDAWMEERLGLEPEIVSYPYGIHDSGVREDARVHGYRHGFRIRGGRVPIDPFDPFATPRLNIPAGLSREGLGLRLAGIGLAE